jgi:hypothetical protein
LSSAIVHVHVHEPVIVEEPVIVPVRDRVHGGRARHRIADAREIAHG